MCALYCSKFPICKNFTGEESQGCLGLGPICCLVLVGGFGIGGQVAQFYGG